MMQPYYITDKSLTIVAVENQWQSSRVAEQHDGELKAFASSLHPLRRKMIRVPFINSLPWHSGERPLSWRLVNLKSSRIIVSL